MGVSRGSRDRRESSSIPWRIESVRDVYVVCEWDCRIAVLQSFRECCYYFLAMCRLVLADIIKYVLQGHKVRRPETRHLPSRKSANVECEERTSLEGRTGSHPTTAGNPSVPQPGLDPDLMSFMPAKP